MGDNSRYLSGGVSGGLKYVKVGLFLKKSDFTDLGCLRSSFVRNGDLV